VATKTPGEGEGKTRPPCWEEIATQREKIFSLPELEIADSLVRKVIVHEDRGMTKKNTLLQRGKKKEKQTKLEHKRKNKRERERQEESHDQCAGGIGGGGEAKKKKDHLPRLCRKRPKGSERKGE